MSALMATRIRRARVTTRLSQAALAERLGVRRSAVAQWERPLGALPTVEHLIAVAVHTQVRFEWLATGRGPSQLEDDGIETIVLRDFAQSEAESRMLDAMRRLSPKQQQLACELVALLSK